MKLAMEIPIAHLNELSAHTDFDFCLAHLLLKYGASGIYTKFYKKQAAEGREVWMDNSFHELGYALSFEDLFKAARLIHPTHFVAEETAKNSTLTYHQTRLAAEEIARRRLPYKLVGSWQGGKKHLEDMEKLCDVVALPFRRPRHEVLTSSNSQRYHFFGIRTLDELRRTPPRSIDTSAPIKYALYGVDLKTRERRLSTPPLSYDLVMSDRILHKVLDNIHILKAIGSSNSFPQEG